MNRFTLVAIVFAVAPTFVRGEPPVVAPAYPGPATVKAMPVSCAPTLMDPLPVTPTVPPPGPCGAGCVGCEKPGLFQSLLACFHRPAAATCTTGTCPAPAKVVKAPVGPVCKTAHVAPPSGGCWGKVKAWFCWKPCGEQLLPAFCPEPYHAPLYVYFPKCDEPTPGIPCASGKCATGKYATGKTCATPTKCATGGCPTGGCPVGPVVSPMVYTGLGMPVVATPVAVTPPAQPQANLLARPFTTP